ncbi:hypothetical protein WDZ92_21825 [Nostoc sp. NIES-2111]
MKSKFLAIVAASTAALGSAILSVPAQAQTAPPISTTSAPVNVNVTVPEVLYLRTVANIDVDIPVSALTNQALTQSGSGYTGTQSIGTADGTGGVDETSPFNINNGNVQISLPVPKVFAVWSNSPRGLGITIATTITNNTLTTTGTSGSTITLASATANPASSTSVPGLVNPLVGGVNLGFTLGGNGISEAGDYTGGTITVTAAAP